MPRLFPRPIHDQAVYDSTVEFADILAGFEHAMTDGQNDYFDLLRDLIETYDKETTPPPISPASLASRCRSAP